MPEEREIPPLVQAIWKTVNDNFHDHLVFQVSNYYVSRFEPELRKNEDQKILDKGMPYFFKHKLAKALRGIKIRDAKTADGHELYITLEKEKAWMVVKNPDSHKPAALVHYGEGERPRY